MAPMVNTDDLADAHELAAILGLSHANSVSLYLRRYPDMPRPVVDLGRGRPRLWERDVVLDWARRRRGRIGAAPRGGARGNHDRVM
jgi:glutathione-regulated potassium-efflux system ancillary protein KefG